MNRLRSSFTRYAGETAAAIRADVPLYAVIACYCVAGAFYVRFRSGMLFGDFADYVTGCAILCCLILPYGTLVIGLIRIAFRLKRRRSLAYRQLLAPRRVARALAGTQLMLVILVLFEAMFTSVKVAFSNTGFGYDTWLANADRFIHFGRAPVKWLLPIAANDGVLRIVEFNYDEVWVTLWLGMLYWIVTSPKANGVRIRYCLTFFLVWVLVGNVAAGLLPTAGPAFYGQVTGDLSRFAKLRSFLDDSASATALTQHYLWTLHQKGLSGLGAGISAFPSMHVAITAMTALFLGERRKWLGLVGAAYTITIMVNSVYLGWHYAIDGYVAVILTFAVYYGLKRGLPALARLRANERLHVPAGSPEGDAVPAPIQ